jgi:hypothetical protein
MMRKVKTSFWKVGGNLRNTYRHTNAKAYGDTIQGYIFLMHRGWDKTEPLFSDLSNDMKTVEGIKIYLSVMELCDKHLKCPQYKENQLEKCLC